MAQTSLPPGFRFHPTDVELCAYYLKRKIMGKKLIVDAIAEVELYKFAPWDLPDKSCLRSRDLEWFFFCPRDKKYPNGSRTNRATPNGYWKTSGKDRTIMLDTRIVGLKKTLIFHEGKAPKGDRTDWVMYEYKMEDDSLVSAGFSKDAYVLCKIFKKSGMGPRIGEQYGAPFNEDEWENAEAGTSMFHLMPSSEVVNPVEDPHAQQAVAAGNMEELIGQHSSAVCAMEESSFDTAANTCVEDMTFSNAVAGSDIQEGLVSGNIVSNEVNNLFDPPEFDGFLLEELSNFLNDSPLRDNAFVEVMEAPMSSSLGAMGPLMRKLDLLLASNYPVRRSLKQAIKLLKEDLEEVCAALVEQSMVDSPSNKARYWMDEVRELSYYMEDFIDDMMRSHSATETKVRSVHNRFEIARLKINRLPKLLKPSTRRARITEIRALLRETSERYERYQLDDCSSDPLRFAFTGGTHRRISSLCKTSADLVGVEDSKKELIEWLTNHEEKQLKVLCITGSAGVGKTTLTRALYRELKGQFECRAFIRVSRNPDMSKISGEILSQVQGPKQTCDGSSLQNSIDSIREHLQDKRYFIVIDDLWDATPWDILNNAFPKGNNCSRILITAESLHAATECNGYHSVTSFESKPLVSQDSEKLFLQRVFGSEHHCPDQLKEISSRIINAAGGLPLAVIMMAGLLASELDNTDLWNQLQQCFFPSLAILTLEQMLEKIVNLCYSSLPRSLKTCLLYLTMFPEGSTIWKVDLLKQWIAEGFVSPTESKQRVAESYFDELVSRGMIQPEKINHNDEVLSFTVHHIVFGLISQKSIEDKFVTVVDYSQTIPVFLMKVHRLSLQYSCAAYASKPEDIRLSQVRSLAFFGLQGCMPSVTNFKHLRVLNVELWGDYDDRTILNLSGLGRLFQLGYLKVACHISVQLPSQIHGLQFLETLEIDAKVSDIPVDIVYLPSLLHLSFQDGTKLPDGIGSITSLQTLKYFDLGNNSEDNVRSLGELINLHELHLTLSEASADEHLKRKLVALSYTVGRLANLRSLTLAPVIVSMTMFVDHSYVMPSVPIFVQRLELLSPVCTFSKLPQWIAKLQMLRTLKCCVRELLQEDIDILAGLPILCSLSLFVRRSTSENIVFHSGAFPGLKYFKYRCGALCLVFKDEALPNLQIIKLGFNIHRGDQYGHMISGFEYLYKLKEIALEIGASDGAEESDRKAAEIAFKDVIHKHARFRCLVNIKRVDRIEEEKILSVAGGDDHREAAGHFMVRVRASHRALLRLQPRGQHSVPPRRDLPAQPRPRGRCRRRPRHDPGPRLHLRGPAPAGGFGARCPEDLGRGRATRCARRLPAPRGGRLAAQQRYADAHLRTRQIDSKATG